MKDSTILYYTLAGEYREELTVKGSRFIATAVPVASKEDALMHIERVRQLFPERRITAMHTDWGLGAGIPYLGRW